MTTDQFRTTETRRFDALLEHQRASEAALRALRIEARRLHDEEGLAWAKIGKALGVTRQAAWERFGKVRA